MAWIKVEVATYWVLFVATFLTVAVWESFRPKRSLSLPAERRWGIHGVLMVVSAVALTLIVRVTPVAVAASVSTSRFGILNKAWLPLPVRYLLSLLILDLTLYATHRMFHSVPMLWRVHEVHHSDDDYDVSTGARFHPLEVALVRGGYIAVIAVAAPPAVAVFAAELLSAAVNLFAHANASLPGWLENTLRLAIVTPDLHRIHHSQDAADYSRNFGQAFPWWDRLFGTYRASPAAGVDGIITGIRDARNAGRLGVGILLAAPFQERARSQTKPAA